MIWLRETVILTALDYVQLEVRRQAGLVHSGGPLSRSRAPHPQPNGAVGNLLFSFEDYSLDSGRRELRLGNGLVEIEPQVFDLLEYLVRNRDRVVTRDDLIESVWRGRIVSESTLNTRISSARYAVGDCGKTQRLIRTLARKGIRFVGTVQENQVSESATLLTLPDKPSIAVLPFQNMSADPEQEYLVDGIVEDIITALSRVKWFFVIARNSSFTYKGKHVDTRQVGRELGVRYVLEGSIRKSGNRVRIAAQLIEAVTGNHVWAEKFEGELDDVFELQDRITETVVATIEPSLELAEIGRAKRKPTDRLDAYDLCLKARSLYYSSKDRDNNDAELRLLDQAIALDPNYAFAKAFAAQLIHLRMIQWWATPEDVAKGSRLAHEALISSRDEPTTIALAAHALAYLTHDFDRAVAAMDRAVRLNPNSAVILNTSGWLRLWVSDEDRAIDNFSRLIRLSPKDPGIGVTYNGLAHAFLFKNEPDMALEYARRSTHELPGWVSAWMILVAASINVGNTQEAQESARRMMALSPNFYITKRWNPFRDRRPFDLISERLRKAGVPE